MRGAREFATARLEDLGFGEIIDTPVRSDSGDRRSVWPQLSIADMMSTLDPLIYGQVNHLRQRNEMEELPDVVLQIIRDPRLFIYALHRALKRNPDLPIHITYLIEGGRSNPSFRPFWNRIRIN